MVLLSWSKWKLFILLLKWFIFYLLLLINSFLKLVEISKAQDIEAGDGTTTVVVIAGALLSACELLLEKGIHPTIISEGFQVALDKALTILDTLKAPIDLADKEALRTCVITSLASKVVSQNSDVLAPIAVDSVLHVINLLNFESLWIYVFLNETFQKIFKLWKVVFLM